MAFRPGALIIPDPALPADVESYDAGTRTVTATSWAAIPSSTVSCAITNPSGSRSMICDVSGGVSVTSISGDLRICPVASGGMVVAAGPGGVCLGWGEMIWLVAPGRAQFHGRLVIPAGVSTTLSLQGYLVSGSTVSVSYLSLRVCPRRYAD